IRGRSVFRCALGFRGRGFGDRGAGLPVQAIAQVRTESGPCQADQECRGQACHRELQDEKKRSELVPHGIGSRWSAIGLCATEANAKLTRFWGPMDDTGTVGDDRSSRSCRARGNIRRPCFGAMATRLCGEAEWRMKASTRADAGS